MIPSGWSIVPLDSVAEVRTGISKSNQRKLVAPAQVPYLRVANVQDGYLDLSEIKTINVEEHEVTRYLLHEGDVLLTEGGDFDKLGRGAVWKSEIPNCLHQNHVFAIRTDREELLPHFLSVLASSFYGKTYFLRCSKQSTNLASINSSQLKSFPVLLPPFDEQRAIVKVLSTWDHAIDLTTQLIAAKQQRKRGLMQQLLTGKKRFKEYTNTHWQLLRAGDIFQPNSKRNNGDEELLSVTQERGVIPRSMLETRVVMPTGETTSYKLVEIGDFIISLRSFQGGIEYSEYQGLVSPAYTVLKPKRPIVDGFYKHLFKSQNFISRLGVAIIGIRDGKQINFEDFASIRLACPELEEQKRIAEVLDTCDQELALLNRKLALLKKQKQGLMQQLLTGKIRVKT